jgi:hypothetical protein
MEYFTEEKTDLGHLSAHDMASYDGVPPVKHSEVRFPASDFGREAKPFRAVGFRPARGGGGGG